ncbi:general substrate transporter [Sphaerosporella brunnea]|uniref:General substrate transporter n=1 Tax=Sphaerosporella brunnea TaxID=1250544 RepID=A0A5J5EZC5_9PEZI|nr:general substrate transporter [Sphaerosporella brunnea]
MAVLGHEDDHDPLLSSVSSSPICTLPEPEARGSWLWILTLSAGISGLLFGYDTASISSALLYLAPSLSTPANPVTTWDKSLITSATSFGALFGGLVAGVCADRWGRRAVIWIADALFIIGALWQAWATTVTVMVAGRIIVGVGVGVGSLIVPLYISELAPASHRGRLVVISVLCITVGQLVAYLVGLLLGERWRWVLGLGALPAAIQAAVMFLMPETPRWQLLRGRRSAAAETLSRVYGTSEDSKISSLLDEIETGIPTGPAPPLLSTLKTLIQVPGNRRALIIACYLQFLQQACGFNSLMYFSATIFAMIGFHNPTAVAMVVAGTNALFTCFAFHLIDRIGRRRMLLWSLAGMAMGLMLCSLGFLGLPDIVTTRSAEETPLLPAVTVVVAIILFVSFYATGLGAIPWLCQSEFFPMAVRGVGTGAATATNWTWNLIVAATFLGILERLGGSWAFAGYSAVCLLGWILSWMTYPETGGLAMEEIEGVLRDGWGVKHT